MYFASAKSAGCDFVGKASCVTPAPQDATSVKATRTAAAEMAKGPQKTSFHLAFLCTHALSAFQQAVFRANKELDRTARVINNVEVTEVKIELTIKATPLVRELEKREATLRPERFPPDAEKAGQSGNQERLGNSEKWC